MSLFGELGGGWYAGTLGGDTPNVAGDEVVPETAPNAGGTTGTTATNAAAPEADVLAGDGTLANDGAPDNEPSPAAPPVPGGKCPPGCAPDNINEHGFPTPVPMSFPRLVVNGIRTDNAILPWPAKYWGPG